MKVETILGRKRMEGGPLWPGLVTQIKKSTRGRGDSNRCRSAFWGWTGNEVIVEAPATWTGIPQTKEEMDTIRMMWKEEIPKSKVIEIKERMHGRHEDESDWYIVPEGSFKKFFGQGIGTPHQGVLGWKNNRGAVKVATLPKAKLQDGECHGELWYILGYKAWKRLDMSQARVEDCGIKWCKRSGLTQIETDEEIGTQLKSY